MGHEPAASTSASLLGRLRFSPDDAAAWREFVQRYGGAILGWCRRWNLQSADADDVTQTVLLKLVDRLRTFDYDPARSFRAYVKTLAHYAWCDWLESRRHEGAMGSGDTQVLQLLHTVEARDDLAQRLTAEFDRERFDEAALRVRLRVEPRTWEAFQLTAVEKCSGAATAERLSMSVAAVFKAKSKVRRLLKEEIQKMGSDDEPAAP